MTHKLFSYEDKHINTHKHICIYVYVKISAQTMLTKRQPHGNEALARLIIKSNSAVRMRQHWIVCKINFHTYDIWVSMSMSMSVSMSMCMSRSMSMYIHNWGKHISPLVLLENGEMAWDSTGLLQKTELKTNHKNKNYKEIKSTKQKFVETAPSAYATDIEATY